jgi:hypothetical protein
MPRRASRESSLTRTYLQNNRFDSIPLTTDDDWDKWYQVCCLISFYFAFMRFRALLAFLLVAFPLLLFLPSRHPLPHHFFCSCVSSVSSYHLEFLLALFLFSYTYLLFRLAPFCFCLFFVDLKQRTAISSHKVTPLRGNPSPGIKGLGFMSCRFLFLFTNYQPIG